MCIFYTSMMFPSVLLVFVFSFSADFVLAASANIDTNRIDVDVGVEVRKSEDVIDNKVYGHRGALEPKVCPPGFIFVRSVNGCYKAHLSNRQWVQAALDCRTFHKDAHLVVIDNAAEQQALVNMMAHHYDVVSTRGCNQVWGGPCYWTAGQRIASSKTAPFVWKVLSDDATITTVSHVAYTNWWPGQPDYWQNYPEDCLLTLPVPTYGLGWCDMSCSNWYCSICEIDMHHP